MTCDRKVFASAMVEVQATPGPPLSISSRPVRGGPVTMLAGRNGMTVLPVLATAGFHAPTWKCTSPGCIFEMQPTELSGYGGCVGTDKLPAEH